MKAISAISALCLAAFVAPQCAWSITPCDGVDRRVTPENKAAWAPEIAKQLGAQQVDVLSSFRYNGWRIVYVDSHNSDEVFLFYAVDPLRGRYINMWSGAAMTDEQQEIKSWTFKNVPHIPQKLAGCFAWYVTNARER